MGPFTVSYDVSGNAEIQILNFAMRGVTALRVAHKPV